MRLGHLIWLAVLIPVLLGGLPSTAAAQSGNTLGTSAALNCGNFLPASEGGQQHAQAVYDADPNDPYGLDGPPGPDNDTTGEPGVACETPEDLGTASPASCQDFLPAAEGGQEHAQALLDSAGAGDPYSLDADGNGIACDEGNGGADESDPLDGAPRERRGTDDEALDGPPPDRMRRDRDASNASPPIATNGTTVVVSAPPLGDVASLEERLDAHFAALEADFTAFEARAENGFGRFEESADVASVEGQGSTVVVSTPRQPADMMQRGNTARGSDPALLTQDARGEETIKTGPATRLKVRKNGKHERSNARKIEKRDRHTGKQRDRG